MNTFFAEYIGNIKNALDRLPLERLEDIAGIMAEVIRFGRQIFVFGNGACAAAASHFVCDLVKGCLVEGAPRVKAFALTDCAPLMTAWANDDSYEKVFVEPLKNYLNEGDLVIGLSASGNSPNVLWGIEYANSAGAVTVGLTGKGGGKLAELARIAMVVPSDSYEEVEDIHVLITHMLKLALIDRLQEN